MNKLIRNTILAFTLLFTFILFQPPIVNAEEPSSDDTVTITYDLNGGNGKVEPFTVHVGTFILPELPEYPVSIRETVISPEGKWYDAFEIDGKRYEFGEEIEVTKDTTIKYLWKDVIYIHRIDATLEAPKVGTIVDADVINVIEDGKLAASGTHNELLESSKIYNSLYNSES